MVAPRNVMRYALLFFCIKWLFVHSFDYITVTYKPIFLLFFLTSYVWFPGTKLDNGTIVNATATGFDIIFSNCSTWSTFSILWTYWWSYSRCYSRCRYFWRSQKEVLQVVLIILFYCHWIFSLSFDFVFYSAFLVIVLGKVLFFKWFKLFLLSIWYFPLRFMFSSFS